MKPTEARRVHCPLLHHVERTLPFRADVVRASHGRPTRRRQRIYLNFSFDTFPLPRTFRASGHVIQSGAFGSQNSDVALTIDALAQPIAEAGSPDSTLHAFALRRHVPDLRAV